MKKLIREKYRVCKKSIYLHDTILVLQQTVLHSKPPLANKMQKNNVFSRV